MADVFNTLNAINVNDHTEKKNGLTYLSWPWAWGEVKKRYPDAFFTIYESANGCFYHTDGATCWVKTGVTIEGLEHIEYLPVMDFKNKSIPLGNVTSVDVNKAIQRSLTKAIARHGLGLYIYAGEDLPEDDPDAKPKTKKAAEPAAKEKPTEEQPTDRIKAAKAWTAKGVDTEFVLKLYNVKSLSEMTPDMITNALNNIDKIIVKQKGQTK